MERPRILGIARTAAVAAAGFLALAAGAAAAAVPAQEAEKGPVDIRRLKFEYKCFFEIPEWKGKAEDRFLDRLKGQYAAHRAAGTKDLVDLEILMADAHWERATQFRDKGDLKTASERAGEILSLESTVERVESVKRKAEELIGSYNLGEGQKALAAGNVEEAKRLLLPCLRLKNADTVKKAVEGLVTIEKAAFKIEEVRASNDLAAEANTLTRLLESIEALFPPNMLAEARSVPSLAELRARSDQLDKDTQTVELPTLSCATALRGVKFPSAPLDRTKASITFTPVGNDGEPWPAGGGDSGGVRPAIRLLRGTYDIRITVPGVPYPVASWLRTPVKDAKVTLGLPDMLPEGMVFVGQGASGFFIDRTEVSVGQVKRVAGSSEALAEVLKESNKEDAAPAWILTEAAARDFAAASGKAIPTREQWIQGAFGPYAPGERPYPWGNAAPQNGTHLVADPLAGEPQPVGRREAGASPHHLLDTAGNVSEWVVVDGGLWTLGGNHLLAPGGLVGEDGKSWLREPAPGPTVYGAMPGAQQNAFAKHRVDPELFYGTGLRMVVPVGR